jgi:hypothetical protein
MLTVSRKTRNDKPEQQWLLKDGNTTIQLVDSTLCLDGGAQSEHHGLAPEITWARNLTSQ